MPKDELVPHHFDQYETAHNEMVAQPIVDRLRFEREHGIISIPEDARYLALGAGQAYAELAIAEGMGIKPENVTLLDKGFTPYARARFDEIKFPGQIVEDGALGYLEAQRSPSFHLVTAIGIEHRISEPEEHERLVRGVAGALHEGGVAIAFMGFMGWRNFDNVWKSYGFESLIKERGTSRMSYTMVLRNPSQPK